MADKDKSLPSMVGFVYDWLQIEVIWEMPDNLSSTRGTKIMHRIAVYPISAALVAAVAWMILPAALATEAVTKQVPAHNPGQPIPSGGESDRKKMQSAMSAAPSSLSNHATIMKWNGTVLREGKPGNVWTCLPDIPNNGGIDPWCVDQSWQNMLAALTAGEKPTYDKIGIAYMLMGDGEVSNITPSGTKEQGQWVAGLKAHLMLLVPDHSMFDYLPTEPDGGPWIMWKGTPYAHVMIPIDSYPNP